MTKTKTKTKAKQEPAPFTEYQDKVLDVLAQYDLSLDNNDEQTRRLMTFAENNGIEHWVTAHWLMDHPVK